MISKDEHSESHSKTLGLPELLVIGGAISAGSFNGNLVEASQRLSYAKLVSELGGYDCGIPLISAPGLSVREEKPLRWPSRAECAVFSNFQISKPWNNLSSPCVRIGDLLAYPGKSYFQSGIYKPNEFLDAMLDCHARKNPRSSRLEAILGPRMREVLVVELGSQDCFDLVHAAKAGFVAESAGLLSKQLFSLLSACSKQCERMFVFDFPRPDLFPAFVRFGQIMEMKAWDGEDLFRSVSVPTTSYVPRSLLFSLGGIEGDHRRTQDRQRYSAQNSIEAWQMSLAVEAVNEINRHIHSWSKKLGYTVIRFSAFLERMVDHTRTTGLEAAFPSQFGIDGVSFSRGLQQSLAGEVAEAMGIHTPTDGPLPIADFTTVKALAHAKKDTLRGYKDRKHARQFEVPIQSIYPGADVSKRQEYSVAIAGVPAGGLPKQSTIEHPINPKTNFIYKKQINERSSAYGDSILAVDSIQHSKLVGVPAIGLDQAPIFQSNLNVLIPLSGHLLIEFSEPRVTSWSQKMCRFVISHGEGLRGQRSRLDGQSSYSFPTFNASVTDLDDVPASSGELCLNTGEVRNFHYNACFFNSAVAALLEVNPHLHLPKLLFPGQPRSGNCAIHFIPRSEDDFDVEIVASMALPLGGAIAGKTTKLPLPFRDGQGRPAALNARGSRLNPWIRLSTANDKAEVVHSPSTNVPENTTFIYHLDTSNSSFGDEFHIPSPELGGPAKGESPLSGRLLLEFGARIGDQSLVTFRLLPPKGCAASDIPNFPYLPECAPPGLVGYDRVLRFPKAEYDQSGLSLQSDPYKESIGIVDHRDGSFVLLGLRAFICQDLFLRLLQVERAIPRDSFSYYGSGRFAGTGYEQIFLNGACEVPYPQRQSFPLPSHGSVRLSSDGKLAPFINLVGDRRRQGGAFSFRRKWLRSSNNRKFGVDLRADEESIEKLEITTREKVFRLERLLSIDCFDRRVEIAGVFSDSSSRTANGLIGHFEYGCGEDSQYVSMLLGGGQTASFYWSNLND